MNRQIPLIYPTLHWRGNEIMADPWPIRLIATGKEGQRLRPTSQWFCIGSCFAERSAKALKQHLLPVHFAAGAALYTPEAIWRWLQLCQLSGTADFEKFCADTQDLVIEQRVVTKGTRSRFLHPHTPGWLEAASSRELLQLLAQQCNFDYNFLQSSDVILITLGSAFSFYSDVQKSYWSNGHRLPAVGQAAPLQKRLLNPEQIDQALAAIIGLLAQINPNAQIVFSVSPVRHEPLAAVDNSLSKAQLLSAVHRQRREGRLYYFPAYEIVMDELRDYRWYDHQRKQLRIDSFALLLERLLSVAASPELKRFLEKVSKLALLLRHRRPEILWPGRAKAVWVETISAETGSELEIKAEAMLAELYDEYPELELPESLQAFRKWLKDYSLEPDSY